MLRFSNIYGEFSKKIPRNCREFSIIYREIIANCQNSTANIERFKKFQLEFIANSGISKFHGTLKFDIIFRNGIVLIKCEISQCLFNLLQCQRERLYF